MGPEARLFLHPEGVAPDHTPQGCLRSRGAAVHPHGMLAHLSATPALQGLGRLGLAVLHLHPQEAGHLFGLAHHLQGADHLSPGVGHHLPEADHPYPEAALPHLGGVLLLSEVVHLHLGPGTRLLHARGPSRLHRQGVAVLWLGPVLLLHLDGTRVHPQGPSTAPLPACLLPLLSPLAAVGSGHHHLEIYLPETSPLHLVDAHHCLLPSGVGRHLLGALTEALPLDPEASAHPGYQLGSIGDLPLSHPLLAIDLPS